MLEDSSSPSFCPELSPEDRRILAAYWRSRGNGEMGAEIAFKQVRDDLQNLGAPAPLLALADRAIKDERKHGHWGRDWALRFGGTDESAPRASRTRLLEFPGASARDNQILRITFCC